MTIRQAIQAYRQWCKDMGCTGSRSGRNQYVRTFALNLE